MCDCKLLKLNVISIPLNKRLLFFLYLLDRILFFDIIDNIQKLSKYIVK